MTLDTIHLLTAVVGLAQTLSSWLIQLRTVIGPQSVVVMGRDITAELTAAGWTPPASE